jgi:two-component system, OmpR family, sensor histidine kinase QseC
MECWSSLCSTCRHDPLPTATTDVGEQVQSALNALEPIARARYIVLQHRIERETRARIEPDQCMHALLNLIENAIKYGCEAGAVMVSSRDEHPFLDIVVDDDGPGVPAHEHHAIF